MRTRRPPAWWVTLVAVGTLAAAVGVVRWADAGLLRANPPGGSPQDPATSRPDWLWGLKAPFERLMNATTFGAAPVTLGMGLLLAGAGRFRPRRGRLGPGALQTLVVALLGGALTVHLLAVGPSYRWRSGTASGLHGFWNHALPGIALGAWVVGRRGGRRWRRDPLDRAARVVPWLWLSEPLLLAVHGLVFG